MTHPPSHWKKVRPPAIPGLDRPLFTAWLHAIHDDFKVLRSRSTMKDGSVWLHVSVSHSDRLPSWTEMQKVKNEFIGEDRSAVHVLPKAADHINCHPYCMHLWAPEDSASALPNMKEITDEQPI